MVLRNPYRIISRYLRKFLINSVHLYVCNDGFGNELKADDCNPVHIGDISVNSVLFADDIVLLPKTKTGLQNSLNFLKHIILNGNCRLILRYQQFLYFCVLMNSLIMEIFFKLC